MKMRGRVIGQAVQALIRSGGHFVVVKKKFAGVGEEEIERQRGGIGALEGGGGRGLEGSGDSGGLRRLRRLTGAVIGLKA